MRTSLMLFPSIIFLVSSGCAWRGLFFYDLPLADGHPVI
ncbi:Uncharacterised protein [Escherichia coli]|nr:hypothetical protein ECFDA506_1348 [Escherichia coli FDA506]EKJ64006.1 hypothetical protein ECFRIK523_0897 [Escherichia coli FRIK523]EKK89647.1 putative membrane protein [Escherichia coli 10.0821]EKW39497.1 putative membrane protein [Escherichia coli 95.1288]CTT90448.1 Uncharacterised protein [Escherichia coli]